MGQLKLNQETFAFRCLRTGLSCVRALQTSHHDLTELRRIKELGQKQRALEQNHPHGQAFHPHGSHGF